jgi:hypothetical protein
VNEFVDIVYCIARPVPESHENPLGRSHRDPAAPAHGHGSNRLGESGTPIHGSVPIRHLRSRFLEENADLSVAFEVGSLNILDGSAASVEAQRFLQVVLSHLVAFQRFRNDLTVFH